MPYSVDEKHFPSEFYYPGETNYPNATFQGEDNAEQNSNKNSRSVCTKTSGNTFPYRPRTRLISPYQCPL